MRAAPNAPAIAAAAVIILVSVVFTGGAQTKDRGGQKTGPVDRGVAAPARKEPPVGITVTLSVYSGRPNPTWTLEPGPDLDGLIGLIKDLKPTDSRLFDYDEWNRLGYASFWLSARGVPGIPSEIHVWRDMAVVPTKDGKMLQATGASQLYERLVSQAEAHGQGHFFLNYRKLPPPGRGAR